MGRVSPALLYCAIPLPRLSAQVLPVLVSIAGSKPTAFQAVSFEQPVPRLRQWRNGGIQAKRARGLRSEVPHDLVHKVSEEGTAGEDSRASARPDTPDLRRT